jgi:hypothetical protein
MLKPAITAPLTKKEVQGYVQFLSHHLGYAPYKMPKVIFAKTAKEYATLFEGYRVKGLGEQLVHEINAETPAFFDHITDTVVFQGFSYREGVEIDSFVIPVGMIVHELIHFFQFATGTYGSYRVIYEGTNEILSCLLTDDPTIDYTYETVFAMGLAMEINDHDFARAIQWMKTLTTHSNKNRYLHRSIKRCPAFVKYNPTKLLRMLDSIADEESADTLDKIENPETRAILTRYSLKQVVKLCRQGHKLISGVI